MGENNARVAPFVSSSWRGISRESTKNEHLAEVSTNPVRDKAISAQSRNPY